MSERVHESDIELERLEKAISVVQVTSKGCTLELNGCKYSFLKKGRGVGFASKSEEVLFRSQLNSLKRIALYKAAEAALKPRAIAAFKKKYAEQKPVLEVRDINGNLLNIGDTVTYWIKGQRTTAGQEMSGHPGWKVINLQVVNKYLWPRDKDMRAAAIRNFDILPTVVLQVVVTISHEGGYKTKNVAPTKLVLDVGERPKR